MTMESLENEQTILATGGYDHTIKLWQAHTNICQRTMQHVESQVNALEITPDRQLLAAACYQQIIMYDLTSNNPNAVAKYESINKNVTGLGFEEDGKWMYSVGEDCRARIWDMRQRNHQPTKVFLVDAPITSVSLHPNQVELFVGDQKGIIYRWDLRTDNNVQFIPDSKAMILDIDINPQGTQMAAVNNKGSCYIWNMQSGDRDASTKMIPTVHFEPHNRYALKCKFSPDGEYLATTSADQTAKIFKMPKDKLVQILEQDNQRWVWDVAFSADSQYVFTASSDGYAKLWNVKTGKIERKYSGHQKAVTALAFRDNS